jgi:hypothetical protein
MQEGSASLSLQTVARVQSNRIDVFGLLSLFNAQRYMSAYFTQDTVTLAKFATILGIDQYFPTNAILMVEGWLFEGSWQMYSTDQLTLGWDSAIAAKANGGDYWSGADFNVETWMTPIFTDTRGPNAYTKFGLYAGSFTIDNVSSYRLNNGEAYLNKIIPIWNGTYYTQTPQQPNGALSNADSMWFNSVSNGIQFPPGMNHDPIQVYNDRTISVATYNYEQTNQVPTSVLNINNYNGEWSGGQDVGFTYNMPFFEHSYKCGDCTNTTRENEQKYELKVQGRQYVHASENSTFDIGVQPENGFMEHMNKESTMIMLLQYFTNTSQPLQAAPQQAFPLPNLEALMNIHVPIYDLKETLVAEQNAFLDRTGYIADNQSKVRTITVWMIVFCCLFFIAGVVCAVIYKKNQANDLQENETSEVRNSEQDVKVY